MMNDLAALLVCQFAPSAALHVGIWYFVRGVASRVVTRDNQDAAQNACRALVVAAGYTLMNGCLWVPRFPATSQLAAS